MQQITQPNPIITIKPTLPPPLVSLTHQLKPKTHPKNPIISAKWGKKRSGSRNNKLILNAIATVASTLKILPEPLDSLVKEFWVVSGGGKGGNFWFRNGFGGDGGNGGRRRRSKGEKLGFWVILVISSGLALWVFLEKERGSDLNFWVFWVVSTFVVYCMLKGWKREIKDWVLGFSCGAAFMGLGLRNNENLVRWVDQFRANFSNFGVFSKKRRRWT